MLNDLIKAVNAASVALEDHLNHIATVDSGITNSRGDEPGVGLARDIEWATNSRLTFLHTKLIESKRWYDISETSYIAAVTAKDNEKEQGERNGPQSEFSNADESLYKAQRYLEVAKARHLPMMSEYNRLVKNYAVITGKDWVYLAKKVGDGGVKVDRTKMAAAMTASTLLGPDKKPKVAAA